MAAWYDLGLAQHAAGDQGAAVASLLHAHRRAPLDARPRDALRQIGCPLPATWADHLGPVACLRAAGPACCWRCWLAACWPWP
jgi:hypothetical protein